MQNTVEQPDLTGQPVAAEADAGGAPSIVKAAAPEEKVQRRSLIARVNEFQPLAICGWVCVGLCLVMWALYHVEGRVVSGANPWLKPIKYSFALGLYAWTVSLILGTLEDMDWLRGWIAKVVSGLAFVEVLCLGLQASRGLEAHYNVSDWFNGAMFAFAGFSMAINTVIAAMILGLALTCSKPLPPGIAWGIRFGLVIFIGASFQGVQMIISQGHLVGAEPSAAIPAMALLNWSAKYGDLRVAHVLGVFAVEIVPLIGCLLHAVRLPRTAQSVVITLTSVAYAAYALMQNRLAMNGKPFSLIP